MNSCRQNLNGRLRALPFCPITCSLLPINSANRDSLKTLPRPWPPWLDTIAFKKTFLKNNAASVTLSFNDIFRSRKSDQHSEGVGFVQDYYRLNNPQNIRLNLSYRFGKIDMSLFKRQNLKSQGEGMQNAQMQ